jgi:murein DD-endopeptidase MepM/ murein hydrolase activator NlpD
MVTSDRFPFGNAVLIETPLDADLSAWMGETVATPAPLAPVQTNLTCPQSYASAVNNTQQRSLYVLYAHLKEPAHLKVGEPVTCGQNIGEVGGTGNALNPHLHFETRAGPSGITIASMAHYDASASLEEMSSYCLWSVSGIFQLVDPLKVLALAP